MRLRLACACLLAGMLSGCLSARPVDDPSLLRNPTIPLSVISRGGAEAMAGQWHVRASSPGYGTIESLSFITRNAAQQAVEVVQVECDGAGGCEALSDGWLAEPIAQNRWRLTSETSEDDMELWVIWIDDGYRTAAIGSPDSDMAFILDRKPEGGADRITAAREVLAFNGYNMAAFTTR